MKNINTTQWIVIATVIASGAAYFYYQPHKKKKKQLYTTTNLERRTIIKKIHATGTIEAKGTLNIGSLVSGIIEKLYAKENQIVKKGQLLAKIDDGREDTLVKQAQGILERLQAERDYQTAFYHRQKQLYQSGHISLDEFERAQRTYKTAQANVKAQEAQLEQVTIQFENKKITSPLDGVIIKENVSLREGVSNLAPPTIIYTIAEDISKMRIELNVDETDIGHLKIGQKANLRFNTYPHKKFYGTIDEISSAPIAKGPSVAYKAVINIDNKHLLLKPGMTVHATIVVVQKNNVLAVPGYLFAFNEQTVKQVAQMQGYTFTPVTKKHEAAFRKTIQSKGHAIKTLWLVQGHSFIEKPVEIGITDNAFFEVVSGLDGSENVVIDVAGTDQMIKMYQRVFKGGLGKK